VAGDGKTVQIIVDAAALTAPDLVTVDALARLQLEARRHGGSFEVRRACDHLVGLIALIGLTDVLPHVPARRLEPRGQAELREQPEIAEGVDRSDQSV
jgi:STAS domain